MDITILIDIMLRIRKSMIMINVAEVSDCIVCCLLLESDAGSVCYSVITNDNKCSLRAKFNRRCVFHCEVKSVISKNMKLSPWIKGGRFVDVKRGPCKDNKKCIEIK